MTTYLSLLAVLVFGIFVGVKLYQKYLIYIEHKKTPPNKLGDDYLKK